MKRRGIFIILITSILMLVGGLEEAKGYDRQRVDPSEDSLVVLGQISIEGRTRTKDWVILRELNVREGDDLPYSELDEYLKSNTNRLKSLSIFNEVDLSWRLLPSGRLGLVIYVTDRFPVMPEGHLSFADRNFNNWWKEGEHRLSRLNLGLGIALNNFRGRGECLELNGEVGFTQKIGFTYGIPFIDHKKRHGVGLSFLATQNKELAYTTEDNKPTFFRDEETPLFREMDVSLWYSYRPEYAVTHQWHLTWQHYWISQRTLKLNPNYLGDGLKQRNNFWLEYQLTWNHVDYWNYPLEGQRLIGRLGQKVLVPERTPQTELYLQYDHYWHPLGQLFTGFIFRGRFSFPYHQPYIFQRNMGYDYDYLRGFEYYVMDGPAFALGRLDLKYRVWHQDFHTKFRYLERIPIQVFTKIYGDAGYTLQPNGAKSLFDNSLLTSAGIGIDIVTLYDVKVRIEYTFNNFGQRDVFFHQKGE